MVSPELPGLTPPLRDPPNQGLWSCVVPAQTWQLGFGICCDGAGEGEMRMMRIGSILKKAGEGDEDEEDQSWFYPKKRKGERDEDDQSQLHPKQGWGMG